MAHNSDKYLWSATRGQRVRSSAQNYKQLHVFMSVDLENDLKRVGDQEAVHEAIAYSVHALQQRLPLGENVIECGIYSIDMLVYLDERDNDWFVVMRHLTSQFGGCT